MGGGLICVSWEGKSGERDTERRERGKGKKKKEKEISRRIRTDQREENNQ